jgi:hypothetical protein
MSSHRHNRSKESASGKQTQSSWGSAKQPTLSFSPDGYDVTNGVSQIPMEFLEMRCARLYIEFLRVSTDGMTVEQRNRAKNHVIFKIDFEVSYNRYAGVRISMEPNWDVASSPSENGEHREKPGRMFVKPVPYEGVSRSTARTIEIPLAQDVLLYYLLGAIMNSGVHDFSFATINDRYFGCRDFM